MGVFFDERAATLFVRLYLIPLAKKAGRRPLLCVVLIQIVFLVVFIFEILLHILLLHSS